MLDLNSYTLNEIIRQRQEEIRCEVVQNQFHQAAQGGKQQRRTSLRMRIGMSIISLGKQLAGLPSAG